ncbi:hypothetical protein [Amycolatopsis echigonensis]|uniref:Uncharacterized protein n=1 Tax=Amycolatopsis echigonensis TaxID=2576905 RepID=A0A8E1W371_9PSEU|nr:hypothetical protein [Amycolatopsis echigonensis]MBB2502933.1 hypothetical protein [Amycolatopsis echigonensis]
MADEYANASERAHEPPYRPLREEPAGGWDAEADTYRIGEDHEEPSGERASTPIAELHQHGLTFHQTGPLRTAGYGTAQAVASLVDGHRAEPEGSTLSGLPGMGTRRVALVCAAVDAWRAFRRDTGASR